MSAQAEVHGLPAPVLHGVDDHQGTALQNVGDIKPEGEGIALPALRGIRHPQGEVFHALVHRGENGALGEAVAGHLIGLPAVCIVVVGEAAHVGKQIGGAARPIGGIAVPEIFRAIGGGDGHELGAQPVDGYGQGIVMDGIQHQGILPCRIFAR